MGGGAGSRLVRTKLGIATIGLPSANTPLITITPPNRSPFHSVVRGVATENDLSRVLPYIRRDYSSSPVYLAIPPVLADKFASTLSHSTIVVSTPDAIIAKL